MSDREEEYVFAIFNSIRDLLAAERIIKQSQLPYKIVPLPRSLGSDCGVCIRFFKRDREKVEAVLSGEIKEFRIEPPYM